MKELADKLNGREYGDEVTEELEQEAKDKNLVIVYGASDDLMELEGAIDEEIGCYNGGFAYFNEQGLLRNECDEDKCPYYLKQMDEAKSIEIVWGEEGYSWAYKTSIPHETFEIMEEGDKFCRGIVFSMESLKGESNG